jgi:hypothetical protein
VTIPATADEPVGVGGGPVRGGGADVGDGDVVAEPWSPQALVNTAKTSAIITALTCVLRITEPLALCQVTAISICDRGD